MNDECMGKIPSFIPPAVTSNPFYILISYITTNIILVDTSFWRTFVVVVVVVVVVLPMLLND
jgi:hypothetical protein